MALYFLMAWNNLWRNKKRTTLAVSSIVFAVIFSLALRSLQFGMFEYLVNATVGMYIGHLQVHGEGYWEKRSLDQSMRDDSAYATAASTTLHVAHISRRLETVALVARGNATKVMPLIGIDPAPEDAMTRLSSKVVAGTYLNRGSSGVMITEGVAKRLEVKPGDSIVVYTQGYQGTTAAGIFPVEGILRFPTLDLNSGVLYMGLGRTQSFLNAPGRLTSVAVMVDNSAHIPGVKEHLSSIGGDAREVLDWQDMLPELVQAIQADSGAGLILLGILYLVVGFGIFGTVMMMAMERRREFGILVAVGMQKGRLMAVSIVETVLISGLGALVGVAAGLPILLFFHRHPIELHGAVADAMVAYGLQPVLPFSLDPGLFTQQMVIVFFIGLVCAAYPLLVIRQLEPVRALRS